jgi:Cu+-exporting ATPase
MNSLITLGAFSSYGYSLLVTFAPDLVPENLRAVYYEAVGVIITLILLGRLLEAIAKSGTGEAIRKLIGLQAKTARIERDGQELEVSVDEVEIRRSTRAPWRQSPRRWGDRRRPFHARRVHGHG